MILHALFNLVNITLLLLLFHDETKPNLKLPSHDRMATGCSRVGPMYPHSGSNTSARRYQFSEIRDLPTLWQVIKIQARRAGYRHCGRYGIALSPRKDVDNVTFDKPPLAADYLITSRPTAVNYSGLARRQMAYPRVSVGRF